MSVQTASVQWEKPLDYSQYQSIVSRMPIGLWVVVHNCNETEPVQQSVDRFPLRVVEINSFAARLLGTSEGPLPSVETQEVLQNFIRSDIAERCQEVMRAGEDREVPHVRYQIGEKILHLSLNILHQGPNSCVILFQDETAQKLASERLLHGQRVAHIGDWDWGLSSNTIHMSEELLRIFGLSGAQLPLTFEQTMSLIHPEDKSVVQNAVKHSIDTLEPFSIYFRLIWADGAERVVHSIGHVEVDAQEKPIRLWGTTQNVTERWLAEEKLRTSESRLRAITDSANDAMLSFTSQGKITFWNPGAVQIFGISSEDALDMPIQNFICTPLLAETEDAASAADSQQAVSEAITAQWSTHTSREVTAQTFSGATFPAEMSLGMWQHNGSTFYTAIVRDITKRRQAENELKTFARQLEASNRELQDFAYIASHDLQEPLRKINAFSDRLRSKYSASLDDTALDYLGRMQNAAQRMQVLINDLLTLSRVTTKGQPFDSTDLNAVVHAVLTDLETTIQQSGGEVIVGDLPELEADPLQMRQLFQNLVSNALKFRHDDVAPVVRIYVEEQYVEEQYVEEQNSNVQDDQAPKSGKHDAKAIGKPEGRLDASNDARVSTTKVHRIMVSDNGIGFEEKYLDRIFQPFQRLHGRTVYTGTGMGLAICRKIVERHSGTITARSTPDVGSTFIITLPEMQTRSSPDEA